MKSETRLSATTTVIIITIAVATTAAVVTLQPPHAYKEQINEQQTKQQCSLVFICVRMSKYKHINEFHFQIYHDNNFKVMKCLFVVVVYFFALSLSFVHIFRLSIPFHYCHDTLPFRLFLGVGRSGWRYCFWH